MSERSTSELRPAPGLRKTLGEKIPGTHGFKNTKWQLLPCEGGGVQHGHHLQGKSGGGGVQ